MEPVKSSLGHITAVHYGASTSSLRRHSREAAKQGVCMYIRSETKYTSTASALRIWSTWNNVPCVRAFGVVHGDTSPITASIYDKNKRAWFGCVHIARAVPCISHAEEFCVTMNACMHAFFVADAMRSFRI
jgi:hypothetical protein